VVEGADPETDRDGGCEDDSRETLLRPVGLGDEHAAGGQRDPERDVVKHTPEKGPDHRCRDSAPVHEFARR
jgi:hypothetical protein